MSDIDFQLLDEEQIDDSIIKRDFIKKLTINLELMLIVKLQTINSTSE